MSGLIINVLFQFLVSLPLIFLIIFWKKSSKILKIIIIITFLITLHSFFTILIYETPLQDPVNYKIDLTKNQSGEIYEFEVYPLAKTYLIGFEVKRTYSKDTIGYDRLLDWPNSSDSVEIILDNGEVKSKYDPQHYNIGYTDNYKTSLYSRIIEFNGFFQKIKVTYKINEHPPEDIQSLKLIFQLSGFLDYYSYHILSVFLNILLVYGSIILFFVIRKVVRLLKYPKKSN